MPKKDEEQKEKEINEVAEDLTTETEAVNTDEISETSENAIETSDELSDTTSETDELQNAETETVSDIDSENTPITNEDGTVTVQPIKFASFEDLSQVQGELNKNLDILMDIKLQMTVELGRTELPIKKVLELTRGSIIELEKVAGEPVELYANGKLVAHGEVVVIEDNFGLRITSITEPEDRLKGV